MTYVISDVHGNERRFDSVLKQIDFQPEDTLYILGDVIDRYHDGIRILRRIMRTPNMKMLLGNHEYMMLKALEELEEIQKTGEYKNSNRLSPAVYKWYHNGGEVTHRYLKHIRTELRKEVCDYLNSLPLNLDVEVNVTVNGTESRKKYKLVHASPVENYKPMVDHYNSAKEFCIWKRWQTWYDVPKGYTMIFGHTPTCYYHDAEPWQIWRGKDCIGIDCGCGFPEGRLSCLRLDDGKEFYSEEDFDAHTNEGDEIE